MEEKKILEEKQRVFKRPEEPNLASEVKTEDKNYTPNVTLDSSSFPMIDNSMHPQWFSVLLYEFAKDYFVKLSSFLLEEREKYIVYPPIHQVWTWTELGLYDIKVVIIGQDPYHRENQAHGLAFSVTGVTIPPSLSNIFKEISRSFECPMPQHGNLTKWLKQGVMLLNTVLTVRAQTPRSHVNKGWETLTDFVIQEISSKREGIVFMLWGADARKKKNIIDLNKHHVLETTHPSPLSAHRGFIGSSHFLQCNKILEDSGKVSINWSMEGE